MSFLAPLAPLAIQAGSALLGKKSSDKAAKTANKAAQSSQVDPAEVARLAEEQARRNAAGSLALEGQYTPENQALRRESVQALLERLRSGDAYGDQALASMSDQLKAGDLGTTRSSLLTDAIRRAAEELALGGNLDVATRNEVTRKALANAGAVGGGGLGLGRTITARDLGLKSMDIANDRLARATTLGQIEQNANEADTQVGFQNRSLRAQLAQALQGGSANRTGQQLGIASFGQSLQAPVAGLDPSSYADIFLGNAQNLSTAQMNQAKLQAQSGRDTSAAIGSIAGAASKIDWGKIFGGG